MARSGTSESTQILLFPYGDVVEESAGKETKSKGAVPARGTTVVLCGTYRKDPEGLRRAFERLKDTGFSVLSPSNPFIETEEQGFVYMRSENLQTPNKIEDKHLDAIQHADFVWFFAPDGYVGPTGALEVGFARASGVPVYTDTTLKDLTIKNFVEVVESPSTVYRSVQAEPSSTPIASDQEFSALLPTSCTATRILAGKCQRLSAIDGRGSWRVSSRITKAREACPSWQTNSQSRRTRVSRCFSLRRAHGEYTQDRPC